ncbi:hypothetical protein NE237_003430 [Protea cynaroides]|uniref:Uncharacterized protein n=1 Tax=Protea cynaroides TaxID=273540 RepID=A0A9Q0KH24_9MAGN|nr:hypothetical protein NE237_003430 [Protea cynaroides]
MKIPFGSVSCGIRLSRSSAFNICCEERVGVVVVDILHVAMHASAYFIKSSRSCCVGGWFAGCCEFRNNSCIGDIETFIWSGFPYAGTLSDNECQCIWVNEFYGGIHPHFHACFGCFLSCKEN